MGDTAQEADGELIGCRGAGAAGVRKRSGDNACHVGACKYLPQAPFSLPGQSLHLREENGEE